MKLVAELFVSDPGLSGLRVEIRDSALEPLICKCELWLEGNFEGKGEGNVLFVCLYVFGCLCVFFF